MKYIPQLTGLRGLTALMIFVVHAVKDGFLPKAFLEGAYNKPAIIAFFILSGYLITRIYLNRDFNRENLKSYFIARSARILPLYFFVLFISVLITLTIYPDFHYDFTAPIKFITALFLINSPYEPWTIPVEFQLYIFFILLWYLSKKTKISPYVIAVGIGLLLLIVSICIALYIHKIPHIMPSMAIFYFGGSMVAISEENNSLSFFKKPVMMWIGRICLLLFLLMPFTKTYLNFLFLGGWYDPFQLALLFLFFTSLIANSEHFFILGTKPVVLFGEISYGFYMAHRPILKITQTHFGTTGLNLVAAFVLTLLFAFLSYKLIEEPSRKWLVKKFK
ncbi:MAG: acyltransferase [Bacteroidia bacterium]|nr:acyltransferase [Bacteroidia bacterium]